MSSKGEKWVKMAWELSAQLNACQNERLLQRSSVDHRLRAAVASLMAVHGRRLGVPRRELARLAHTSLEAAIRAVQRWRRLGWVEARWKNIYIKRTEPFLRLGRDG